VYAGSARAQSRRPRAAAGVHRGADAGVDGLRGARTRSFARDRARAGAAPRLLAEPARRVARSDDRACADDGRDEWPTAHRRRRGPGARGLPRGDARPLEAPHRRSRDLRRAVPRVGVRGVDDGRREGGREWNGALYVPGVGPFVQLAQLGRHDESGQVALAIDGAAQIAGLAMAFVALASPKKVFVRQRSRGARGAAPVRDAPRWWARLGGDVLRSAPMERAW